MVELDELLQNVSIIGGAGKMGKGIAALMAMEMVRTAYRLGKNLNEWKLNLIDPSIDGLKGTEFYVETIARKTAERTINDVRDMYVGNPGIVHNVDAINQFVADVRSVLRGGTDLEAYAKDSKLVFEAATENEVTKADLLRTVKKMRGNDAFVLTNTSSIPISSIGENSQLWGNVIGYHFYNPPVSQRLLELISNDQTNPELVTVAKELAARLGKTVVESGDVAGFIGNGHFMRECILAGEMVQDLVANKDYSESEAIFTVDSITRDYLVRPMGIFQLMDYVGTDVVQMIFDVMNNHIKSKTFASDLVENMVYKSEKTGGQESDGSQKEGFFRYGGGKIVGVYDMNSSKYTPFMEGMSNILRNINAALVNELPSSHVPWKALLRDKEKEGKLDTYFGALATQSGEYAELARNFLTQSGNIAENLVRDSVAKSMGDVGKVLMTGFGHLYNPTTYSAMMRGA